MKHTLKVTIVTACMALSALCTCYGNACAGNLQGYAAKATQTTAISAVTTQSRSKYHEYFDFDADPKSKTLRLSQTHGGDLFPQTSTSTWYFFHFDDFGTTGNGYSADTYAKSSYENPANVFYSAGYFGMQAMIKDNSRLQVWSYDHTGKAECTGIRITSNNNKYEKLTYSYSASDGSLEADLRKDCYTNGFYAITATFRYNGKTVDHTLYLFVDCKSDAADDMHFYICYGSKHYTSENFSPAKRANYVASLIKDEGVTPGNSLNSNLLYPSCATVSTYDTPFWINKSYDILAGYEGKTKAFKALLFHDWMTSHLVYDYYKVNVLVTPRYWQGRNKPLDQSQYLSRNNTGVCLDFANIYAIMCREQGIPCTILTTDTHAWNAVYINGEWVEVDLTTDVNRYAYNSDYTDISGTQKYCYDGYFSWDVNHQYPTSASEHFQMAS